MHSRNSLNRYFIQLFVIVLVIAPGTTVLAQTQQADAQALKNVPFLELVDLKVSLTSEIAGLEQVILDLPKKIEDAEIKERKLSEYNDALKKLNDQRVKTE